MHGRRNAASRRATYNPLGRRKVAKLIFRSLPVRPASQRAMPPTFAGRTIKSCAAASLAILLPGCSPEQERSAPKAANASQVPEAEVRRASKMKIFQYGSLTYVVPARHVLSFRTDDVKSLFVRLKFDDFPAEMIFDASSIDKSDRSGAPRIFSINDRDYPKLEYFDRNDRLVVCRTGMAAQTGCGTRFQHQGNDVALIFPVTKKEQANELVLKATQILDDYSSRTD